MDFVHGNGKWEGRSRAPPYNPLGPQGPRPLQFGAPHTRRDTTWAVTDNVNQCHGTLCPLFLGLERFYADLNRVGAVNCGKCGAWNVLCGHTLTENALADSVRQVGGSRLDHGAKGFGKGVSLPIYEIYV